VSYHIGIARVLDDTEAIGAEAAALHWLLSCAESHRVGALVMLACFTQSRATSELLADDDLLAVLAVGESEFQDIKISVEIGSRIQRLIDSWPSESVKRLGEMVADEDIDRDASGFRAVFMRRVEDLAMKNLGGIK